jgi:uncharacterized protein
MSTVFLCRVTDQTPSAWPDAARKALAATDPLPFIGDSELVAIKLHVGEPGVSTFLPPDIAKQAVDFVKGKRARPFLTDTSVLYAGPRSNGVGHTEVASRHGFDYAHTGAPFLPADGLKGNIETSVVIDGTHFRSVNIARSIADADALVVVSHATGHLATGFGATLKNLGMGCASRKGKLLMHSDTKPFVKTKACQACGQCIASCPEQALSEGQDAKAVLDDDKCIGCGECIAQCRYDAIGFRWDTAPTKVQEKVAEHALGVVRALESRVVCLLGMVSMTKDCDCLAPGTPVVARDIGFAASLDPVALDQAAMDLVKKAEGKSLDRIAYPNLDGNVQLAHAERIGLGSRSYEIVEI